MRAARDHHAKVAIDLEEAYAGAARTITLQRAEADDKGRIAMRARKLNVTIPRGVHAGQHIRLVGQGAPGAGQGKPGDLYLEIEFHPHAHYRVERRDVYLDLPVALWEAALGATVQVPTPSGKIELKIPAGSVAGSKLRLKGRGIPGSTPGDFYAALSIALPPADSETANAFYHYMTEQFKSFKAARRTGSLEMDSKNLPQLSAIVLEELTGLTLIELSRACAVHAECIVELVEEGVIAPLGREPHRWRFSGIHMRRVGVALRLQRDLGVNLAGAALALQLLDEVDALRTRLQALGGRH